MKISCCSIAYRNHPQMDIVRVAEQIGPLGYDAFEVWGNHLQQSGTAVVKALLDKYRWTVPMISPYFNFTATREAWEDSLRVAQEFIEYAVALNCPLVRVFTGHVPSAQATEAQWRACAEGLQLICDWGAAKGLRFALETHSGQLIDTWPSVLRLIELTGRDNLKVNYQPGTFGPGNELEAIEHLFPYIVHVHYNNSAPLRLRTRQSYAETGAPNWVVITEALAERGYDGFISVEHLEEPIERWAAIELAYLRGLLG